MGLAPWRFTVVWNDNSTHNIHGQRYDSAGTPVGTEFQVNTDITVDYYPTVAALPDGGFVVTWFDTTIGNIHGQRYSSNGTKVGCEFQVNTDTFGAGSPSVAPLSDGGIIVVWYGNDGNIHAQTYDSDENPGIPVSPPSTLSLCEAPSLCYDSSTQGLYTTATQGVYSLATQQVAAIDAVVGTVGEVCVPPSSTFNPATQKPVPQDAVVGVAGQVCVPPSSAFDPTTQSVYSLATQKAVPQDAVVGTVGEVCVPPSSVFDPATQKPVPQDAVVGTAGEVCVPPSSVFDPATQKSVPQDAVVGTVGEVCVPSTSTFDPATQKPVPQDAVVGTPGEVCVPPSSVFDPATQKPVPQDAPVGTPGDVCVPSTSTFDPVTQQTVSKDAPVGTPGEVCVPPTSTFNPATQQTVSKDAPVGTPGEVCVPPSSAFDPVTQDVYNFITQTVCNLPNQCLDPLTYVPQGQECFDLTLQNVYNISTQNIYNLSNSSVYDFTTQMVCTLPTQCVDLTTEKVVPIATQVCNTSQQFDPSTQGLYNLSTQEIINKTANSTNDTGAFCVSSSQDGYYSVLPWQIAVGLMSTWCIAVGVVAYRLYGQVKLKDAKVVPFVEALHTVVEMTGRQTTDQPLDTLTRDASKLIVGVGDTSSLMRHHHLPPLDRSQLAVDTSELIRYQGKQMTLELVKTGIQVFLPLMIMQTQMYVTNALQTVEDQAIWLISLFEKEACFGTIPEENIGGLPYLDQEMCFAHQDFDFLSANICPLYGEFG